MFLDDPFHGAKDMASTVQRERNTQFFGMFLYVLECFLAIAQKGLLKPYLLTHMATGQKSEVLYCT